jgi:hypothetical protein
MTLTVGDRVAYSDYGIDTLRPREPMRVGTVVGHRYGTRRIIRVKWDGRKTIDRYYEAFITLAPPEAR